jgi:hypothetical protein
MDVMEKPEMEHAQSRIIASSRLACLDEKTVASILGRILKGFVVITRQFSSFSRKAWRGEEVAHPLVCPSTSFNYRLRQSCKENSLRLQ